MIACERITKIAKRMDSGLPAYIVIPYVSLRWDTRYTYYQTSEMFKSKIGY